jgi:hypothetical protein
MALIDHEHPRQLTIGKWMLLLGLALQVVAVLIG